MLSYEYIQFLDDKIIQYLPQPYVRVGDKINCRCFVCGDSKKSSTKKRGWVYLKNASYFCFNCGVSLSGIKMLKLLSGSDYESIHREYVEMFLKSGLDNSLSAAVWKPNSIDDEPSLFNLKPIDLPTKMPLSDKAREYLNRRKVLDAPFLKEDLYSIMSKDGTEEYILIPWRINGSIVYYQVNDFLKFKSMKYIFPKGRKKVVYGLDNVDPSYRKIFAFEGVYDSLFVKNGIATGTKSITSYQMALIKERWPYHEVVAAFDNDIPGFSATKKLIENAKASKFFVWFDAKTKEKDINDAVLAKNDTHLFTSPKVLDSMTYDSLQMKLWMISNGKWKDERNVKKVLADFHQENPLIAALSN